MTTIYDTNVHVHGHHIRNGGGGVGVYADTLYTDIVGGGGGWVLWSGRAGKNVTVKLLSSAG